MKHKFLLIASLTLFFSCSKWREAVMPYYNLEYTGQRLFPIEDNDAEFTFRAWINYGTSIDRVVTVTNRKNSDYEGRLFEVEFNGISKKGRDKNNFRETAIVPKSGFEKFESKVDSLRLMEITSQNDFPHAFDVPVAIMVIEIKSHGKFNHFRFSFDVDQKHASSEKYDGVKSLIANEFNFRFYFPDDRQPNFR